MLELWNPFYPDKSLTKVDVACTIIIRAAYLLNIIHSTHILHKWLNTQLKCDEGGKGG